MNDNSTVMPDHWPNEAANQEEQTLNSEQYAMPTSKSKDRGGEADFKLDSRSELKASFGSDFGEEFKEHFKSDSEGDLESEIENLFAVLEKPSEEKPSGKKRAWKTKALPRVFTVRTTEAEYQELTRRAEESDASLSRFLVQAGLGEDATAQKEARKAKAERQLISRETLFVLQKIGVNINQIAHALNSAKHTKSSEVSLAEVDKNVREFYEQIEKLIKETKKNL